MPTVSTALDTDESWHYEFNSRLSDPAARSTVHVDQHGQLYLEPTNPCETDDNKEERRPVGLLVYINAWSLETDCDGLVFLSQPLTVTNSSCTDSGATIDSGRGGNYYGLVCQRNRTEWCQRGYKADVYWPRAIGQTCDIRRTGVDKSRCYNSGQLSSLLRCERYKAAWAFGVKQKC